MAREITLFASPFRRSARTRRKPGWQRHLRWIFSHLFWIVFAPVFLGGRLFGFFGLRGGRGASDFSGSFGGGGGAKAAGVPGDQAP